jgi:hypothetical protein
MSHFHDLSSTRQRIALWLALSILGIFLTSLGFAAKGFGLGTTPVDGSALTQTDFIRQIALSTNDVVYSSSTGKLYASVPSIAGSTGNRIATINPATGTVDNSVFIGSEPTLLAMSNDGDSLYALSGCPFRDRRIVHRLATDIFRRRDQER